MNSNARLTFELILAALVGALFVWMIRGQTTEPSELNSNIPAGAPKSNINDPPISVASRETAARTSAEAARETTRESRTLLFGTITDRLGQPVNNVGLSFVSDAEEKELWCSTPVPGNYSIAGLRAGAWSVEASGFGYRRLKTTIQIPESTGRVREDLIIDRSLLIPVRIKTADGRRVISILHGVSAYLGRACTVIATRAQPGKTIPILTEEVNDYGIGKMHTSATRLREMEKQPPDVDGLLELNEDPPCFASFIIGKHVITTKAISADMTMIDITVPNEQIDAAFGSIKIRVLDAATGAPHEKIFVSLNTGYGGSYLQKRGDDGTFNIEKTLPGRYTLWVQDSAGILYQKRIELEPGQALDLGTVEAGKVTTIKGIVRDAANKPAAVRISILDISRGDLPGSSSRISVQTDLEGKFTFQARSGMYQVAVHTPEWALASETVDTSLGQPKDIELILQRGTLVIFTIAWNPQNPARLIIKDKDGRVLRAWNANNRATDRVRLAPGTYTLQIDDASGLRKSIPFDVGRDTVKLDVSW